MSRKQVYIETTIPSFYHEIRQEPEMIARRNWTRDWWDNCSQKYELVTSVAVIEELSSGNYPNQSKALNLIRNVRIAPVESEVIEIVDNYIFHKAMPKNPRGDALHVALASYHKCDFLLIWNCQHLANANKFGHIRSVNTMLNLLTPIMATPLELRGGGL